MRKIKEVLRLHYELQLNQRQIGRSCGIGQATVHDYLQRAEAAGVGWPLPEDWDESRLQEQLFGPATVGPVEPQRSCPDFAAGSRATATSSASDVASYLGRASASRPPHLRL